MKKITIIGAGLTGTLLGILLARQGYPVEIIERNPDPRSTNLRSGKSINLTLCERGIKVLQRAGLKDEIEKYWVPAYGRYIHLENNLAEIQPYGNYNEALYSISRQHLNSLLLSEALKIPNLSIMFDKKCTHYDLETSKITLVNTSQKKETLDFSTLIAADGVYSSIRQQMQRNIGFNYSQQYSKHINKELRIPAEIARKHQLKKNHLHIWPRNEFMIIAFPNIDESFTCTLQLPSKNNIFSFDQIKTSENMHQLFNTLFSGVSELMPDLESDFFKNPGIPMMTVRCSPWNIKDKIVLIGDAAHGIWPSYGQGANAGFEDCNELVECIALYPDDLELAFSEFEKRRKANTDAIADLSENHFDEIRRAVADPHFLLRKKIERKINLLFPSEYFSLYSRIAFTTIPYYKAVSLEESYRKIIDNLVLSPEVISDPDSEQSTNLFYQTIHQLHNGVLT